MTMVNGMNIIDVVIENLDKNDNITEDVKKNLLELSIVFNKNFPSIDLSNLCNRLKTLKIEPSSKYLNRKNVSNYNPVDNTLSINLELLQKEHDIKHVMMYELLKIITAKDNNYGFDNDKKLVALNAGYTEILTNYLVGNESDNMYHEDEVIATNLIARMIGDEVLMRSYFTNDFNLINNALRNAGLC